MPDGKRVGVHSEQRETLTDPTNYCNSHWYPSSSKDHWVDSCLKMSSVHSRENARRYFSVKYLWSVINKYYIWNISGPERHWLFNSEEDTLLCLLTICVIACVSCGGCVWFATSVLLRFGADGYTHVNTLISMCAWSVEAEELMVLSCLIWATNAFRAALLRQNCGNVGG